MRWILLNACFLMDLFLFSGCTSSADLLEPSDASARVSDILEREGTEAPKKDGSSGSPLGGGCETYQDCQSGLVCLLGSQFPQGTCALPCDAQKPSCPDGSHCISLEPLAFCLKACEPGSCREGYQCLMETIGEDKKVGICFGNADEGTETQPK